MAGKQHRDWTREEHVLAFNLYCKIPFGRIHHNNPQIMELAKMLGRTPGSVSMKLSNFARHDPELKARGIKGLSRGAKGEEEVWAEFENDSETLAFESEQFSRNSPDESWKKSRRSTNANCRRKDSNANAWCACAWTQHSSAPPFFSAYDDDAASLVWRFPNCSSPATSFRGRLTRSNA